MNDFIERISKLSPKRLVLLAAELQTRLHAAEELASARYEQQMHNNDGAIAVIGLGLRFPGGLHTPEEFWDFLSRRGDAIRQVPPERWDAGSLYDPDPAAPGKLASLWGGFVDDIDQFDPQFFGITPREANSMDPQQRIMLEVCWQALERAGYAPDRLGGSRTGVFVGACNSDYYQLLLNSGSQNLEMYTATGSAHSVISGRVSYVLGLQGPSLTVDTACSSSLVALHLACQSLRNYECDMALAGGVNAILSPSTTIVLSKAKMLAPDGRCKAFDAAADGFVRSEGCGVVLLKRLADAEADHDNILAIVRGSAINQDGRSNGLTAPNGPSQVAVIAAALADAGLAGSAVGYVETHGTGTPLGDPIEVQALAQALGAGRSAERPLLIGSVKTNLGHLESAAGVAGFIKLVLALGARTLPPHLHLKQPNPLIAWDELPVRVAAQGAAWSAIDARWIGGVSSFGFSGVNVHMILEAAPPANRAGSISDRPAAPAATRQRPLHLLQLSARSPRALEIQARNLAASLETAGASLADIAYTVNTGRAVFAHRLALVARTPEEAQRRLAAFAAGDSPRQPDAPQPSAASSLISARAPANRRPAVAFLFSGHGGQYAGMGSELYAAPGAFRTAFDECASLFLPHLGISLVDLLAPADQGAAPSLLGSMTVAQPALFALQYSLVQLWRSWGLQPDAVAGHSIGEYAAACAAGVLRLEDAVTLVAARSRLLDAIPEKGVMAAVFASESEVAETIHAALAAQPAAKVAIAAINGPQATVISGSSEAVDAVVAALAARKVRSRALAVGQAAHSPLIDSVLDEFESIAAGIAYREPQIPFVSSLFGRTVTAGEVSEAGYWRRHLRQPVRFSDAMGALHAAGSGIFVEIGPSPMLIALGQRCLADPSAVWAPSLRPPAGAQTSASAPQPEWRQLLDSAAALFVHGVDLDWQAFDQPYSRRRLPMPTYPFERQRYWFTEGPQASPAAESLPWRQPRVVHPQETGGHPLLGRQLHSPALQGIVFETEIGRHQPAFLDDHTIFGEVILPSPAYLEIALSAADQLFAAQRHAVVNFTIHAPLLLPQAGVRSVQLLLRPSDARRGAAGGMSFQVLASEAALGGAAAPVAWKLHATGELLPEPSDLTPASFPFDPDALRGRCPQHIRGSDYYATIEKLGLSFGAKFQGIGDVWIGDGESLGRIELPAALADDAGHYRFHPALLDACFHLLGAPLAKNGMDEAYLLIGIDRFVQHRSPGPLLWNHTSITHLPGADAATFVGDILLYNGDGQLVAEAHGLQLKRAGRAALSRALGRHPHDWLYQVEWRQAPLPSRPATSDRAGSVSDRPGSVQTSLVLVNGGDDATAAAHLANLLRERGDRCVVVDAGAAHAWTGAQWASLLAGPELHSLTRIVDLRGLSAKADDEGAGARLTTALLALIRALVERGQPLAGGLWLATSEAQPVFAAPSARGVHQSPLWGLGRVLALEQPELWGGLIDLEAVDGRTLAATLLAELDAGDGEDQVAWRAGRRYAARLTPLSPAQWAAHAGQEVPLRRDAAYLITGGLGGLGLALARWLAQQGAGHLVLTGRRGLAPAPAIAEIERLGCAVTVVAADVADEQSMAALFARFGAGLPPLAGVIHAAADLSSAPLAQMEEAQLRAMLRPKLQGAWNLHHLSKALDLDFFVLFSSTTALLGAAGLGHYAAANAFLDAFAHYRRSLGLPAHSINWGTWSIMAAASGAEQQRVAEFGLQQMGAEEALALLGDCLRSTLPQIVVASANWNLLKPAYEARRLRPLLALINTASDLPAAAQGAAIPDSAALAAPQGALVGAWSAARQDDRHELVLTVLRNAVAKIIGAHDPAALDPHQGLFEMGMDSLMSVELKTRLEREAGCSLPSTLTFNYPTIADLADYLEQHVLKTPELAQAAPVQAPSALPIPPTSSATSAELDELSADELATRLRQRLNHLR